MRRMAFLWMIGFGALLWGHPYQAASPVIEISLIEDQRFQEDRAPTELTLGVEMRSPAVFKLLMAGEILKAGQLQRGLNFVAFPSGDFFRNSGTHVLTLDLLQSGRSFLQEIEIDVSLDSDVGRAPDIVEFRDLKYVLSLYVGDRRIAGSSRSHYQKFPLKVDLPPLPLDHRPYDPEWKNDPLAGSFSILQAVALAVEGYKEIRRRTAHDAYTYEYTTKKVIVSRFLRSQAGKESPPVNYVIRLSTRSLEAP